MKKQVKIYTLIWVMLTSMMHAQTCNYQLDIQIIDFHDSQPLFEAIITNLKTGEIMLSDKNGKVRFTNLCRGEQTFSITHPHCDDGLETINLLQNQKVTWFLEHHIITLEKLETLGYQKRATDTHAEIHIHQEEIEKSGSESLGSILKSVSGVNGLETGNAIIKPMIHGMHSSRIIMLNHGVRQEDMEWGVEHAPTIDINALQDIRIIKGSSALRYGGDAIGGIIMTEYPKLPKKDTLTGKIGLTGISNGRGSNINAQIQKGFNSKWAMQMQASYKKHGDFSAPNYYLSNSGSEQKAMMAEISVGDFKEKISANYSFLDTKLGILTTAHFGNLNDLANAINAAEPFVIEDFSYQIQKPYQHISHHLAQVKGEKRFAGFGKLEANYAFQFNKRQEYDVRLGEVTDVPSMDVELITHSGEIVLTQDKLSHLKIAGGINFAFQDNFSDPVTQNKRLIPDYDKLNGGAFVSVNYQPGDLWTLNAGMRYDYMQMDTKKYYFKRYWDRMNYNDEFAENIIGDFGNEWLTHFELNFHTYSATLGVAYEPNNYQEIALNYALANRPPNPAELFSEGLHHSALSIELGDVRIQPETAHKISLNYAQKVEILHGLQVNILGHYNQIQNYIYQIPTGAEYTIRGSYPVWSYQQIDANIYGFDTDVTLDINAQWQYQSKFSYVRGKDNSHDLPLIQMPPFNWQQQIKYQSSAKWSPYIAMSTELVGKQNQYPDYNFTLNVLENGEDVTKLVDISSTPKGYFLLTAEAGIALNQDKNPINIVAKCQNLTNQQYRNYLNRLRYFADEMGRQFTLSIIYKF